MARRHVQLAVRLSLATIFMYAAIEKLLQDDASQAGFETIFGVWSRSVSFRYGLICCEIGLSIWLFSGLRAGIAAVVALSLLSAFSGVVIVEFQQEHPKPCGCLGVPSIAIANPDAVQFSLYEDLIRNVLMITGAAWIHVSVDGKNSR
jgi:uncharacterized membrane protein YphA (DoxX/SURF4 family)